MMLGQVLDILSVILEARRELLPEAGERAQRDLRRADDLVLVAGVVMNIDNDALSLRGDLLDKFFENFDFIGIAGSVELVLQAFLVERQAYQVHPKNRSSPRPSATLSGSKIITHSNPGCRRCGSTLG